MFSKSTKYSVRSIVQHVIVGMMACAFFSLTSSSPATAQDDENRLFEMRIYTANEGKLEELNARFREHTNRLFEKHGMDLIGYWVPRAEDGSSDTLVYILAYPDMEARAASWQGFLNDEEWKEAYAASIAEGRLVKEIESRFMDPTDYSPIK